MTGVQNVQVTAQEADIRLDRWFRRHYPGLGHGRLEKLMRTGQIRVDGRRAKASTRLVAGQTIRVPPLGETGLEERTPRAAPATVRDEDVAKLQRAVIYIDDDVIALNKPPGLAVQGGTNVTTHVDAMLDGLRFGHAERPRLVHRLDKDTSGILLLARSAWAAAELAQAFRGRDAEKTYWALVVGAPKPRAGRIDVPLIKAARPGGGRERVGADPESGQRAITLYATVDSAGDRVTWLVLRPETGRTHQLRVHCCELGTPIVGDGKYGGARAIVGGLPASRSLLLHARALSLPHPRGETLSIEAELPDKFIETWKFFGFDVNARYDPFNGAGA